jgi:uncharacterized protein (DUF58 family)
MIPATDLALQVRRLQIRTRKSIAAGFAGGYRSAFKGRGLEFDEVREYTPGDDVRDIDWNVTARTGRPFVKRYIEERQLKVLFAVDVSASQGFGTASRRKCELAAEFCALVAFSAIRNNDTVGLLLFSDRVERFVPPAKGSSHALRLVHELLAFEAQSPGTDIAAALGYLARILHRRCVVFLVSDFLSPGFERALRILARRHDVMAVRTSDPCELRLPDIGLAELTDPETGRRLVIDASAPDVRDDFHERCLRQREAVSAIFRAAGVDEIAVSTDKECASALVSFFRARETRRY